VLAPKSGKKAVKVFCVESGRWTRNDNDGTTSSRNEASTKRKSSAVTIREDQAVANAAAEFKGYYNKGSMSLRKVVEKQKDQTQVWSELEKINSKNKTETAAKTYMAISSCDPL
jgi:hypothetical protein